MTRLALPSLPEILLNCTLDALACQELLRYMSEKQNAAVPFVAEDVWELEKLLGRPLRGVAEWAADHKGLFGA